MDPDKNVESEPFGVEDDQGASLDPVVTPVSDNDKMLGGLVYVSQIVLPAVLPAVLLLSDDTKRRPFLRYHSVQSLALLVATVLYYLVASVAYVILSIAAPVLSCVLWSLYLVPTAAMLYYGYLAFRGTYAEIPWLTQFLKHNRWL